MLTWQLLVFSFMKYLSCDCQGKHMESSTRSSMRRCTTSRACTSMVHSVMSFLRSSLSRGWLMVSMRSPSCANWRSSSAFMASSLPSSSSSKASLTSWVKKVRVTTMVFCALYLKIHWVRGMSSYATMATRYSSFRASCMLSTTFCSHISTGPSHTQSSANCTTSPSPECMAVAALVGSPFSSVWKVRLCTLSKFLGRWRRMSWGLEPLDKMSSKSAGATK
mmetsp:Transcript_11607/g.31619  ORF Transcript_11607/g.31619 Transcript_11607/m.31619 type:complete len:221 (+) Transcript_11607:161-823(+)